MKDSCQVLEMLFKLNEDHFIISANYLNVENFISYKRVKLATRLLTHARELVSKFSKWTLTVAVRQFVHLYLYIQA